jgi:carbamoyltransferase
LTWRELRFPHSLGLLYSAFTAYLGFRVNNGEYKVMGMAPYGRPRYLDEIYRVVQVDEDGGLHLNMGYFSFQHSTQRTFNQRFVDLFGPACRPESEFLPKPPTPQRSSALGCSYRGEEPEVCRHCRQYPAGDGRYRP